MDVVAHAGAVRAWVIIAPHIQKFAPSHSHLGHKRQQVVWNTFHAPSPTTFIAYASFCAYTNTHEN